LKLAVVTVTPAMGIIETVYWFAEVSVTELPLIEVPLTVKVTV
jgi:hypothetical protein